MRKLLLITLILLSITTKGQIADSIKIVENYKHLQKSANHLDKFHRQAIFGLATEFLGATLIAGAYVDTDKPSNALLAAGIAVGAAGFFIFVNSFLEVHDAAIELKKIKPASTGVGIAYSF